MKRHLLQFAGGYPMKRRTGLILLVLVLMAGLATACGRAASEQMGIDRYPMEAAVEEAAYYAGEAAPSMGADVAYEFEMVESEAVVTSDTASFQDAGIDRLIIRTADMSIVVTDTEESLARIAALVESNGGWVVSSYVFQAEQDAKSGTITVRVPAEGFQSALDAITALAVEVQSLSTSGQDVTEEYVDLEARLGNLEATAERVRGFLDETRNVEEALAVNQELSRLEGEIEVIKGRMQYLSQSAAFSTITVNLTPDILAQPVQVGGWQPGGVAKQALEALISGLQTLANVLIWLVIYVLPIALLIGIPVYLIVRAIVRRRRAKREPSAPEQPVTTD